MLRWRAFDLALYSFLSLPKSLTDLEVVLGETLGKLANEVAREGMGIGSLIR